MTTLWQSAAWEKFQKSLGKRVWRIDDQLIVEQKMAKWRYLEIPKGPTIEPSLDFWSRVLALGKAEKSLFIRCSSENRLVNWPKETLEAQANIFPDDTLLLDLSGAEEEILAQMKEKGRYNIRLAAKKGVTVEKSDDVVAFVELLKQTTARDGFASHGVEYFQKMIEALGDNAILFLAYPPLTPQISGGLSEGESGGLKKGEKKPIAGGIFTFIGDTAVYYYGASGNTHRELMAPYAVQWAAITEAKKRGCTWYDFLGIAPVETRHGVSHPWAGVTEFKRKFGGFSKSYPKAKEIVLRPCLYWVLRIAKRLREVF